MNNEKFIEKVYEVSNVDDFHCFICDSKVSIANSSQHFKLSKFKK